MRTKAGDIGDEGLGGRRRVRRDDERIRRGALAFLREGAEQDVVFGVGTWRKEE